MGPAGANGTNGAVGATGPAGAKGNAGTNGTNGTDGATGPTGPAGTNGVNGVDGATGPTGPTGASPFFTTVEWGQLSGTMPTTATCGVWTSLGIEGSVTLPAIPNNEGFEFSGTGQLTVSLNGSAAAIQLSLCLIDSANNITPMIGGGLTEAYWPSNTSGQIETLSATGYEGVSGSSTSTTSYAVGLCIQPICHTLPTAPITVPYNYPLGISGASSQFAWGGGVVNVQVVPNGG